MLIIESVFTFINHPHHITLHGCPVCKSDVSLASDLVSHNYFICCPSCNLIFGLPSGYSCMKHLADDWNHQEDIENAGSNQLLQS